MVQTPAGLDGGEPAWLVRCGRLRGFVIHVRWLPAAPESIRRGDVVISVTCASRRPRRTSSLTEMVCPLAPANRTRENGPRSRGSPGSAIYRFLARITPLSTGGAGRSGRSCTCPTSSARTTPDAGPAGEAWLRLFSAVMGPAKLPPMTGRIWRATNVSLGSLSCCWSRHRRR
jgi:hypothetical protein